MEVINLSSRSFKGLRTLELPNTVYNTEGKIYIYEDPVFYKCHESVFKSLTKQRRCQ